MRSLLPILAAIVLAACDSGGGSLVEVPPGPTPGCNPVVTVAPSPLTLSSGGSATVAASIVPCGLSKHASWSVTDTSVATVAPSNDTSAVVTGRHIGTTTVAVSLTAFPAANTVLAVQVQ